MSISEFLGEDFIQVYEDYKNELPVKMTCQVSSMMYENIEDQELIKKVLDAIMGMRIGEKTGMDITDAERNFYFTYADGMTLGFLMIKAGSDMMIYNLKDKCNYAIEDDNGLFDIKIEE